MTPPDHEWDMHDSQFTEFDWKSTGDALLQEFFGEDFKIGCGATRTIQMTNLPSDVTNDELMRALHLSDNDVEEIVIDPDKKCNVVLRLYDIRKAVMINRS